jgi:predicted Zn-dependent peptidase
LARRSGELALGQGGHHDAPVNPHSLLARGALLAALATALPCLATEALAASPTEAVNIPFTRQVLPNGLTVIFHPDRSQPLVAVNVSVDVGSRDEPARRTGFAHLFEHLMFMGTARVPEKMFDVWMENEGAWNNAWTTNDRTDYFEIGPSHTLPLLLWMEADRLATLGSQIDQAKLETQRGVVQNERRQQTENQPYGIAELRLPELLFPEGHPYHHPVIGSHADLTAATVADVRAFFAQHYVPANISLVVAGDFDPAEVSPRIERWFGAIPKAEAGPRPRPATGPELTAVVRETLGDAVTLPKVIMAWHSPAAYAPGDAELDLLSEIMTSGKASRLYKSLVYDKKIAQSVVAYQASMTLGSHFAVEVLARPGVELATIEKEVDEVLAALRSEPVTQAEIDRAKNQYEASFIGKMQSLATRAELLNRYQSAHGDPGWAAKDLQRYLDATPAALLRTAHEVLDPDRRVILQVVPKAAAEGGAP